MCTSKLDIPNDYSIDLIKSGLDYLGTQQIDLIKLSWDATATTQGNLPFAVGYNRRETPRSAARQVLGTGDSR
jgi:hypothetical protein